MSIKGLTRDKFAEIIKTHLTPSRPISNPAHLKGRELKLKQIERAFNSDGKHIFIYGDRGIGKTSLAQSAAILHQSSDADPIVVSCDQATTTFGLIRDIAKSCLPPVEVIKNITQKNSTNLSLKGFGLHTEETFQKGMVPAIESINDAVIIMQYLRQFHSKDPIIIVDEFDRLTSPSERTLFADLIKQLSDRAVGVRLIITGIGKSLDDLIGSHLSMGRYLSPVQLEVLSHDARWEIIQTAATALNVTVDREFLIRIGQISDGFPYYIHLAAEMMFWALLEDERELTAIEEKHFTEGVNLASQEAEASLKTLYEIAIHKYKNSESYEETLWSVADNAHFQRQVSEIYETSYLRIAKLLRPNEEPMSKTRFYERINNLKNDRHGRIIESTAAGSGWYQFRENVVRGYVRLRAEQKGVRLGPDILI